MLIEKHISWLVINNVVGCPHNCSYCFLGENVGIKPIRVATGQESIADLVCHPEYKEDIPVAVMINTDPFATLDNCMDAIDVLSVACTHKLKNLFVLVTKRAIPDKIITHLKLIMEMGLKLAIYVSYSGLPEEMEKGTRDKDGKPQVLETMKLLKQHNIPCVHYWRPLIPQNSNLEVLTEVYNNVKDYCVGSVMTGLKLYPQMESEYWPEAKIEYNKNPKIECIFPKGVFNRLKTIIGDYPVFVDNFCMLSLLQGKGCDYGIYNTERCKYYNNCPYKKLKNNPCSLITQEQKKTCKEGYWGNSSSCIGWKEI